jgi:hypothetical protein
VLRFLQRLWNEESRRNTQACRCRGRAYPPTPGRRAELCERSFALLLDRGGMRRAWLRGCENLRKRYLVHVAGYNLGLIMRLLVGAGTPREFLARVSGCLLLLTTPKTAVIVILIIAIEAEAMMLAVSFQPNPDH